MKIGNYIGRTLDAGVNQVYDTKTNDSGIGSELWHYMHSVLWISVYDKLESIRLNILTFKV